MHGDSVSLVLGHPNRTAADRCPNENAEDIWTIYTVA